MRAAQGAAIAAGLLDCSAIVGYVLNINPIYFQSIALTIKFALAFNLTPVLTSSVINYRLISLSILIIPIFVSLATSTQPSWFALTQATAFAASLIGTLAIITPGNTLTYLKTVCVALTASAALYLFWVAAGMIETHYGRYRYFSGYHFNLGSEIAVIACLAGSLSLKRTKMLFLVFIVNIFPVLLMQGRSALIAIILNALVMVIYDNEGHKILDRYITKRRLILLAASVCGIVVMTPYIIDALLINDLHRGIASGYVGREERWNEALETFIQHPFTGLGYLAHSELNLENPHNFFFIGLSELGLLFLAPILVLAILFFKIFRQNRRDALLLASLIPLFAFNARLFNLNPYPFIFFTMIFSLSVGEKRRHALYVGATPSQPRGI